MAAATAAAASCPPVAAAGENDKGDESRGPADVSFAAAAAVGVGLRAAGALVAPAVAPAAAEPGADEGSGFAAERAACRSRSCS